MKFRVKKQRVTIDQKYALYGFHFAKKEGYSDQRMGPEGEALKSSTVKALRRKGLVSKNNKITAKGEEYLARHPV